MPNEEIFVYRRDSQASFVIEPINVNVENSEDGGEAPLPPEADVSYMSQVKQEYYEGGDPQTVDQLLTDRQYHKMLQTDRASLIEEESRGEQYGPEAGSPTKLLARPSSAHTKQRDEVSAKRLA